MNPSGIARCQVKERCDSLYLTEAVALSDWLWSRIHVLKEMSSKSAFP